MSLLDGAVQRLRLPVASCLNTAPLPQRMPDEAWSDAMQSGLGLMRAGRLRSSHGRRPRPRSLVLGAQRLDAGSHGSRREEAPSHTRDDQDKPPYSPFAMSLPSYAPAWGSLLPSDAFGSQQVVFYPHEI